jgi:hypothetical protein
MASNKSSSTDYAKLRHLASNAKAHVLLCSNLPCTNHYRNPTTRWSVNKERPWLMHMSCTKCKHQWSTCIVCNNVKIAFTKPTQIGQHYHRYHHETKPTNPRKRVNHPTTAIVTSQITKKSKIVDHRNSYYNDDNYNFIHGKKNPPLTNNIRVLQTHTDNNGDILKENTETHELIMVRNSLMWYCILFS